MTKIETASFSDEKDELLVGSLPSGGDESAYCEFDIEKPQYEADTNVKFPKDVKRHTVVVQLVLPENESINPTTGVGLTPYMHKVTLAIGSGTGNFHNLIDVNTNKRGWGRMKDVPDGKYNITYVAKGFERLGIEKSIKKDTLIVIKPSLI